MIELSELRWYTPEVWSKYPHFQPPDALVWDSFLERYGSQFFRFSYDVPLASYEERTPIDSAHLHKDWSYLTALKIDCIGECKAGLYIFEVKQTCTLKAFGQIFVYSSLFNQYYNYTNKISKAIVCNVIVPSLRDALKNLDITLFVV